MILPFKGYRYSEKAGNLKDLIAPPYDVIGAQYRKELMARSQYNIVHLTLPESFDSEYHNEIKNKLEKWCREKILVQDTKDYFYLISQRFSIDGRLYERYGFIGLFDLKKSERVIRHEIIFNRYRDDRIKLLNATKSNLEPIFLLFEDSEKILEKKSIDFEHNFDFEDYSISFSSCNPEILSELIEKINNGKLFIADGHHRFQASLEFFLKNPGAPEYIMVYLTNLFSDSLVVLPTHRAVKTKDLLKKIEKVKEYFLVEEKQGISQTLKSIEEKKEISFGVYFNRSFQTWTLKDIGSIKKFLPEKFSEQLKSLDVVVLHHFLIDRIFDIPAEEKLFYDRDPLSIVEYVNKNPDTIGFFMQKPDLIKIREVSLNGEILPPKTTFFYPKIPSGLVIARYEQD